MLSTLGYSTVNPTADNFVPSQNTVQCADDSEGNPRYSIGECPNGYAYQDPVLNFSDLISGPDTGLGDGLGSGAIVTVWGQNLGSSQNASTIQYCDSLSVCRDGHVYYWKNADGTLPGGPANLYESHGMQEIAFSIPDSALGNGRIKVVVNGVEAVTNSGGDLAFTVRAGNIYHVKSTGNDSTGDGSFANPWLTVARSDIRHAFLTGDQTSAGAGDTVYVHDVDTTAISDSGSDSYAYYNNKYFLADDTNQFAYASYPNTRANLYGKVGVQYYLTTGVVVSKLSVFASNCDDETLAGCTENGTLGIGASDYGRIVGNAITDRDGMCASGQAGAITSGVNGGFSYGQAAKVFGNYVYDYGCPNTGKLHHTTYMTIRDNSQDRTFLAPRIGWNYLKGNYSKNGIHFYDENAGSGSECGQFSDDILVHDNVVVNQSGAGISYESACGWSNDAHIYNNVLANVGLPLDVDCVSGPSCGGGVASAIQINDGGDGGIQGDVYIYNNTVHKWDAGNQSSTLRSCITLIGLGDTANLYINDNICYTDLDRPFLTTFSFSQSVNHDDNISGSKNTWYTSASSPSLAVTPTFDTAPITTDPLLTLDGSQISVDASSPVINQSSTTQTHDIYGVVRSTTSNTGAVQ